MMVKFIKNVEAACDYRWLLFSVYGTLVELCSSTTRTPRNEKFCNIIRYPFTSECQFLAWKRVCVNHKSTTSIPFCVIRFFNFKIKNFIRNARFENIETTTGIRVLESIPNRGLQKSFQILIDPNNVLTIKKCILNRNK